MGSLVIYIKAAKTIKLVYVQTVYYDLV